MKPSLMSRLEQPNFAVSIRAACPCWGAQDVTARPWNTSTKSHSPPAGRFVQESGRFWRVPIQALRAILFALKKFQSHQCIKEIIGAARMEAKLLAQLRCGHRTVP